MFMKKRVSEGTRFSDRNVFLKETCVLKTCKWCSNVFLRKTRVWQKSTCRKHVFHIFTLIEVGRLTDEASSSMSCLRAVFNTRRKTYLNEKDFKNSSVVAGAMATIRHHRLAPYISGAYGAQMP